MLQLAFKDRNQTFNLDQSRITIGRDGATRSSWTPATSPAITPRSIANRGRYL